MGMRVSMCAPARQSYKGAVALILILAMTFDVGIEPAYVWLGDMLSHNGTPANRTIAAMLRVWDALYSSLPFYAEWLLSNGCDAMCRQLAESPTT